MSKLKKSLFYILKIINKSAQRIFLQKTKQEIAALEQAAAIVDCIFQKIKPLIKPGITEKKLLVLFEKECKKFKVKKAFDFIIASGPNSAVAHAIVSERKIQKEDLVVIDIGVIYKGYRSDMTRTLLMNPHNKKAKSLYQIVYQAQQEALNALKAGVSCTQLDAIARNYIKKYGFGDYFIHGLGHGVGLKIHEAPFVNQKNKSKLKKGMVITIEPGIYLPGYGGVRIEDMVLVTQNGYQLLTKSPKE